MLKFLFTMPRYDHMYMARHYTISVYLQAFVFLTVADTLQENISIFGPDEYVEPLYDSEGHKMNSFLITDFKFSTHK
jgi:hypothetical protein